MISRKMKGWLFLLIGVLIISTAGCSKDTKNTANNYNPGIYTGVGMGKNGALKAEVEFSENEILSIKVMAPNETDGISEAAVKRLPQAIVENQSLAVDVISGASSTSKGILSAVQDAVQQAGGKIENLQTTVSKKSEVIERETDLAIVGAGAAGLMAATRAVQSGLDVIILEKGSSTVVSNFANAGGPAASESRLQAEEGVILSTKTLFDHMYNFSHATVNSKLLQSVLSFTGKSIDLMLDLGIKMELIPDTYGVGFRGRHFFLDDGAKRINPIVENIEEMGGEILLETTGKELLTDTDDTVIGVKAEQADGTTLNIRAKAVLVSTGGFLGNKEMLSEHFPGGNIVSLGNTLSTGDGINMVLAAGGVLDTNFALLGNEAGGANSKTGVAVYDETWSLSNQNLAYWIYGGLVLNRDGFRFVNEELIADEPLSIGGEIIAREGKVYFIADQGYIDGCSKKGIYSYLGSPEDWRSGTALWEPVLDKAPSQIQEAIDQGWAFKAENLGELANLTGLKNLESSVKRYNELAREGVDEDFGKPSYFMKEVSKGPFYAFEYEPSAWGTNGGVKVDYKLRALNKNNIPIEGLFVAGVDAGSMYAAPYYNNEGASLGVSLGSGLYAGEVISNYLHNK